MSDRRADIGEHEIQFGTLSPEGLSNVRMIRQSAVRACPHFIIAADHYREDQTCRCDDPEHAEMASWGYEWNEEQGRWEA